MLYRTSVRLQPDIGFRLLSMELRAWGLRPWSDVGSGRAMADPIAGRNLAGTLPCQAAQAHRLLEESLNLHGQLVSTI
jgi:hypothetical protein